MRVTADIEGRTGMRGAAGDEVGRNPAELRSSMSRHPWAKGSPVPEQAQLMERVVERSNMQMAYRRVKQNRGAPGVDGMSVEQLGAFCVHTGQRSKSG